LKQQSKSRHFKHNDSSFQQHLKDYMPENVKKLFEEKGILFNDIIYVVKSDMSKDAVFCDSWIAVTKEEIAVLSFLENIILNSKSNPFKKKTFVSQINQIAFNCYFLKDLKDYECDSFISTGRLTAFDINTNERIIISYFSNSVKNSILTLLEKLKNGKIEVPLLEADIFSDEFCPKCHYRYPDKSKKICPKCTNKAKLFKKMLPFFKKYKKELFLVFLTIFLSTVLTLLSPFISGKIFYDEVLTKDGEYYGQIVSILLAVVFTNLLSAVFSMINSIVNGKVAAKVICDFKKTIFSSFERLSLSFFTARQTGGLMVQVNNDANTIYWFFCDGIPYFVTNSIQLLGVLIIMFLINPILTVAIIIIAPLFFIGYKLIMRSFRKLHAKSYSKNRSFNGMVADVFAGFRIVKVFSKEELEIKKFEKKSEDFADANYKVSEKGAFVFPLFGIIAKILSYIAWIFGGWLVIQGTMGKEGISYGDLIYYISLLSMLYNPINFLSEFSGQWSRCGNALQRLFEVMDAIPDVRESENPVVIDSINGKIEFNDVSFSYEKGRKIIENVTFTVNPGEILGIVGHTGAGKSTLANLLMRLYDVDSGYINVDNINIKDFSFKSLRDSIAIVSQETYFFRDSILENIRYASPEADFEAVVQAAKTAGAHDFIMKCPDGYNTQIGNSNKQLSGGEKQRISIARAILKNPKILILDEATSAMDTETERHIQRALKEISKGRTTIMIAHRLSTLRDADKLIVIENGKMIESGTHKELLAMKGTYAKLYSLQMESLKIIGIDS